LPPRVEGAQRALIDKADVDLVQQIPVSVAIVVILSVSSCVGSREDHAVAVSDHDATPFTSEGLVHHVRRRAPGEQTESLLISAAVPDHRP
jgi:hypothetical protein